MEILVFQHVPHEHPGLIADFAKRKEIKLNIVELWKEYKIPTLEKYSALIVMGGPMGVYESKELFPAKDDEIKTIRDAVGKIPVLGHCLGSQLIAHALGARVYPNLVSGILKKEIGYYDVKLTDEGKNDPLFKGFSETITVLEWHGDAFDLPAGAKLLATSPLCQNQAFNYKNAYGLLFHFEFTPEMIAKQIQKDSAWIHKDFALDEKKLLMEAEEYQQHMRKQCNLLLTNFLSII